MATIIRTMTSAQGQALSNRYQAKRFTYAQDMHSFLNKGDNAMHWRQINDDLKSGIYFTQVSVKDGKATIKYINEKSLQ